ncbi:glycoside hydrolase family 35 protein [Xylariaceae sp. FL0804]|nr:glycoside hydrolase family 35 protein [Xylariaceae sp. FL0804]
MRLLAVLAALLLLAVRNGARPLDGDGDGAAVPIATAPRRIVVKDNAPLQDVVTWDEHSLLVRGERVMIMSGEFHPWRLPVPSLWLDVFQKIRAAGFNCVSFYSYWGLLEGKQGNFTAEGVFAFEPFFEAASNAGVYLIARPGPYINAEVSFGGFPGWMQRVQGHLRTPNPDYLVATDNYAARMGEIIAKAQITNGGPIILYQPENEYTLGITIPFPSGKYMQYVEDQARAAGVVVPFISNDAAPLGQNSPGTGKGAVDIYGFDDYPLKFDCANPSKWPALALDGVYHELHELQSPKTPLTIPEFQGGAYDPWGGSGFNNCAALLNEEFERVFYKNNFAAGTTIHNIYMLFGGTNWGNLGYPGGYTSYDYGAAIAEDRTLTREKYSEVKLEAEWLKVSKDYLVAKPGAAFIWTYANNAFITVTRLEGDTDAGEASYFIVRHSDYTRTESDKYTMRLPTSQGKVKIPTLFDALTLNGRDSKIMATDYNVSGHSLLYTTAEVFTHHVYEDKTVLVVYTGPDEMNELAVKTTGRPTVIADESIMINKGSDLVTLAWATSSTRRIVQVDDLHIYILDRNSAYRYWVPEVSGYTPVIINGPYLVRNASVQDGTLSISADFNASTTIEVIGAPSTVSSLSVNGRSVTTRTSSNGSLLADIAYDPPALSLPDLAALPWSYLDSLPEVRPGYDDSAWPRANLTTTSDDRARPLDTPTSLIGSDYGFHTGALAFRGRLVAGGAETALHLTTQGGTASGHSVWLDGTLLGSAVGSADDGQSKATYALPPLTAGAAYVLTVLVDQTGYDENYVVGVDAGKAPRGILDYRVAGGTLGLATTPVTDWRVTGNLGGEAYADVARGPLNEGGLYAERAGYHLPRPPVGDAAAGFVRAGGRSPVAVAGLAAAAGWNATTTSGNGTENGPGVHFYTAPLTLDLPFEEWDIPLAFVLQAGGAVARVQLYVNGWQFGKFIGHIGPQTRFPVPEGILNYRGENWVALLVWVQQGGGAALRSFTLEAGVPVLTGRDPVALVDSPAWVERPGAY